MWLATLTRQGRGIWRYPGSEILPTFGLLNFYLSWWRFAPVTVGCVCLPNLVGDGIVENSWGANWIFILFILLGNRITHRIWYLPDKKQEWVQIHNILQELSQEQIYVKEYFQDGQSSHRNRIIYPFNEFLNTLRKMKVMKYISTFLVWTSVQQRMIRKKPILPWFFDFTLKKTSIHRLLKWWTW